jgi:putative transposase
LTGRIFDNQYDLAVAVMDGMKARSDRHNYTLDRFIFNST